MSKMSQLSKGVNMKRITASLLCLFVFSAVQPTMASDLPKTRVIDAIIGEAENQGPLGMSAVAHAIRNRGTLARVYGERSPRVRYHLYSSKIFVQAVKAWEESAHGRDITRGANSWYSEDDLKEDPGIMDRCDFKGKIMDHYFFNCKM